MTALDGTQDILLRHALHVLPGLQFEHPAHSGLTSTGANGIGFNEMKGTGEPETKSVKAIFDFIISK